MTKQERGAFEALKEAVLLAYGNSCKRSEGHGKWTVGDQSAHEALAAAVAQIETLGVRTSK